MSTKPPSGTRDFLPAEIRRRQYVMGVVREVYERYGFEPLETPAFENIDTLLGKYGEEGNKLIFKILRRGEHESSGEADLALRYDLTVPLARVVAQYQSELPRFFKRYQMQPVWRADRPAKGRFREFYQCDIDSVGSTSTLVEVEQLTAVSEVLERLGFGDFEVRLNHRAALTATLDYAGIPGAQHADALTALDKLDKIGQSGVEEEFTRRGIESGAARKCLQLLRRTDGEAQANLVTLGQARNEVAAYVLDQLRQHFVEQPHGLSAVEVLQNIVTLAEGTSAAGHIRLDPSLARGLSYYTGAIMEITVPDLAGSLGGGGRYDNLVGMFLGREVPACGFSLGLERIIVVMTERNMFPDQIARAAADVMVTLWKNHAAKTSQEVAGATAQAWEDSLDVAASLRSGGLRVDVYPDADNLGKQFKYASSRHVPFVAVVGDDERAGGTVSVKDLRTGEQQGVVRSEAAAYIRSRLARPPAPALIP